MTPQPTTHSTASAMTVISALFLNLGDSLIFFIVARDSILLSQSVQLQVALRRNPESIRYPVEECKQRRYINGFCNLWFGPPDLAQLLNVLRRRSVRRLGHLLGVLK